MSRYRDAIKVIDGHSVICDAATSERLGRVRQRDTTPEHEVRSIAYELGLRYRTRNRDLPGSPDIANRGRHWAVFVHGCYWHRHEDCYKATTPKRNREFWLAKFERNRERDHSAQLELKELGFEVIVIWECELSNPDAVRERLARLVTV